MSQPTPYNRQTSFTNYAAANPTSPLPGNLVDTEFNAVKTTADQILANLKLIQRDDGKLANASVGLDQLSPQVTIGFAPPAAWVSGTAYSTINTVFQGTAFYSCLVAHTAGTFATDLAAGYWKLIVDLSTIPLAAASQIAVTPSGSLTTNVQTSLQALDSGKAALSHTHTSTAITDSTAAGRAMLTAANVAAQQTLLGLGSLAYLNSIPVTAINAQLAFPGDISPAALSANTNDWVPTGWATNAVIKLSSTGAINITGFSATTDGDYKVLQNVGSYTVSLVFESSSSAVANRITGASFPLSYALLPGQSVAMMYDGNATRWRILSQVLQPAAPPQSAFKNLVIKVTGNTAATVAADFVAMTDGTNYLTLPISSTLNFATTGANALDTGAIAQATWYYVWAISTPAGVTATLVSTSSTAPTLPSGYTFKARIGALRTASGSAQLMGTYQFGRRARYVVGLAQTTTIPAMAQGNAGSTTTPTWVAVSVSAFVPPTAGEISITGQTQKVGASNLILAPNNSYGNITTSNNPPPLAMQCDSAGSYYAGAITIAMTLESTNVYWASTTNSSGGIYCTGWEDNI